MEPESSRDSQRSQRPRQMQEGPNWVLIVGGALLSTLSIRLGWKLKQLLCRKHGDKGHDNLTGNGMPGTKKMSEARTLRRNICTGRDQNGCYSSLSGSMEIKRATSCPTLEEESSLPLVTVPIVESNKDNNGAIWTSPEHAELPRKPFHHSYSSDSPLLSESGSEIFSRRDVINKLRQQLKRRDEMIIEMQAQIKDLQNSLKLQMAHSAHFQSLLDSANRDLFESEREIQQMRKAIADHCFTESPKKPASCPGWQPKTNGHSNGYLHGIDALDLHCIGLEKAGQDNERVEMLKREVQELKEIIEGKEFLLRSYKEQKIELSAKVTDLQQRLHYQVPSMV